MQSQTTNLTGTQAADPAATLFNVAPPTDPVVLAAWKAALEETETLSTDTEFMLETEVSEETVVSGTLESTEKTETPYHPDTDANSTEPVSQNLPVEPALTLQQGPLASRDVEFAPIEKSTQISPREAEAASIPDPRHLQELTETQSTVAPAAMRQPESASIRFTAIAEREQSIEPSTIAATIPVDLHAKGNVLAASTSDTTLISQDPRLSSSIQPQRPISERQIVENPGRSTANSATVQSNAETAPARAQPPLATASLPAPPTNKTPPLTTMPLNTAKAPTPAPVPAPVPSITSKQVAEPALQVTPEAALVQKADADFNTGRAVDSLPQAAAKSATPEVARQISTFIAELSRPLPGGPVEISLSPEELGRVKLSFSGPDAAPIVALSAERPETLELLRRNIDLLAQDMRRLGYSEMSFTFNEGSSGDDTNAPDDENARISLGRVEPEPTAPSTSQEQGLPSGGLDIRL